MTPVPGTVGWVDLTVADAESLRDFYAEVVGWTPQALDMGGYSDYVMNADGKGVSGVCHARGVNADIPPVWLVYFVVKDVEAAVASCESRGGKVLRPAGKAGPSGRFAVIQDPAGAVCALFEGPAAA